MHRTFLPENAMQVSKIVIFQEVSAIKKNEKKIVKCSRLISSPGLCPWRAYVVTQALASASVSDSALAQCLSFQMCA